MKREDVFLLKKWKMGGVFFGKKVDLSSTQGALCTVSVFFYFTFYLFGGAWWRGTVVERRSMAGELSLSCARPAADG